MNKNFNTLRFTLCVTLTIFLTCQLFGQVADTLAFTKEAGLDAFFVNRVLPFERDIGVTAPYLISYRKYRKPSKYNRYGLDVEINGDFQDNGSISSRSTASILLDLKFGRGNVRSLSNGFFFHHGWDLLPSFQYRSIVFDDKQSPELDKTNTGRIAVGIGGGPFIGVQYQITKRIGIYTEIAYYGKLLGAREIITFEDPTQETFVSRNLVIQEFFILPGAIILYFKF